MAPRVRPISEFVHEMGREPVVGVVRDLGGQGIDIVTKGADLTGAADSTGAINAALAEAVLSTPPKAVIFPPGRFLTTGGHDLTGKNGLSIIGAGIGATTLVTNHATNDIFSYGTSALADLTIGGFSVIAPLSSTRTAGWFFRGTTASPSSAYLNRARFFDLDLKWQTNGIWIPQFEFAWLARIFMSDFQGTGNGIGFKIGQTRDITGNQNQGSELYLTDCQVYGSQFLNPGNPSLLQYGIWIEDCQAVYATQSGAGGALENNWRFVTNASTPVGTGITNCFFDSYVSDATKTGHSTYITGAGYFTNSGWSNSHLSGAGNLTGGSTTNNGMRIDCGLLSGITIDACRIQTNKGTGLYIAPTAGGSAVVSGCILGSNGGGNVANNNDSIFLSFAAGTVGANLIGNLDGGVLAPSTGVSVRIPAATTTKNIIVGNRWISGVSYGAAPEVNANNV